MSTRSSGGKERTWEGKERRVTGRGEGKGRRRATNEQSLDKWLYWKDGHPAPRAGDDSTLLTHQYHTAIYRSRGCSGF